MTFMPIFKRYQTQKEVQVNVTRKNNGKHEFHVHFLALELVFFLADFVDDVVVYLYHIEFNSYQSYKYLYVNPFFTLLTRK